MWHLIICVSSAWNLSHVVLLAPGFLRWFLDFRKICSRRSGSYTFCFYAIRNYNVRPLIENDKHQILISSLLLTVKQHNTCILKSSHSRALVGMWVRARFTARDACREVLKGWVIRMIQEAQTWTPAQDWWLPRHVTNISVGEYFGMQAGLLLRHLNTFPFWGIR